MKTQQTQVQVRLSASMVEQLDEWRRKQGDLPSRPEALRRMLEATLKASQ